MLREQGCAQNRRAIYSEQCVSPKKEREPGFEDGEGMAGKLAEQAKRRGIECEDNLRMTTTEERVWQQTLMARAKRDAEEEERTEIRLVQEAARSRIRRQQESDEIREIRRARDAARARPSGEQDEAMRQHRHVASAQRDRIRIGRETSADSTKTKNRS
ncbi:unnamed protein product [Haemonchus placei]|uniref:CCDC66 domain-containing protein n=1 Tax=Haemonchus placei TaxID=6290 RepID=A0A0N4VW72_HAEPC|nr:unnamed protein product [Haemonchus placei]